MLLSWRLAISALFEADTPSTRPRRDLGRFDLGVCPGCRGLRTVASPQCTACGSAARVTADA
jgi:hypothetical protein